MWSIKEEEVPQISEKEPCTLASMSQTTMLGIISAEACASKRAMEILSLQADETEARLECSCTVKKQATENNR